MNIDFRNDNYRFLVRCSAIILNENKSKVMLFQIQGRDFWMLPGGRVEYLEDSKIAITREIEEELGQKLKFKLICIEENILKERKIHSIDFCYVSVSKEENLIPQEDKNQVFEFVSIDDIDKYDIKPDSIKEIIKNIDNINIQHTINYE